MPYSLVLTTTSSEEEAKKIAHTLLENKLAACVNILPKIVSLYIWKNKVCEDSEFLLFIKTKKNLFEETKECILKSHSYDLPEIIMIPIENGLEGYLSWIKDNTKN